ncbi:MAG TPA: ATP-binding protein [Vicinamibacterales bacterium]
MRLLKVLLVEDTDSDAELVERALRRGGLEFEMRRVETEKPFRAELDAWKPDVVLADYKLPQFDGLSALRIAQTHDPELPFLVVSGTLGDEKAVEVLRLGATDYVLKDRLSRLVPAIERALRERAQRQEQRRVEEQLERARRMDTLGRVAGTIAHELNNVLMSINMAVPPLRESPDRRTAERVADQILAAVKRGQRVTGEVARFTTPTKPETAVVDLTDWLKAFSTELQAFVGSRVVVETDLAVSSLPAAVDVRQLEQVMTNLAANARDAMMPQGGRLTIGLRRAVQAGRDYAEITAADSGSGMPPEVLARLFEPLFTTKRSGTGLGLAVSYQMITTQGGLMYAESTLGSGTFFHILVPAA